MIRLTRLVQIKPPFAGKYRKKTLLGTVKILAPFVFAVGLSGAFFYDPIELKNPFILAAGIVAPFTFDPMRLQNPFTFAIDIVSPFTFDAIELKAPFTLNTRVGN